MAISRSRMLVRISTAIVFLLFAGASAAFVAAPYLPRLIDEGYPQLDWPAPGSFASFEGADSGQPFASVGTLNDWSRQLFDAENANGKALLVYQGGTVKLAHYAEGVSATTRFNSYSMAKSLTGALLLRAVAEGKIAGLDAPLGDYLPNVGDAELRAVPLRDFAMMRSGIAAEAGAAKAMSGPEQKDLEMARLNPFGPMIQLHMSGLDAVAKDLRSAEETRGKFSYQNANTALIGAVLEAVYGEPLEKVMAAKIWQPAGAGDANWRRYDTSLPVTPYCCIYTTPSDWLRVGVYLMRNGTPEAPFLPDDLWRAYLGGDISDTERVADAYGLQAHHNVLDRDGEPLQGDFTYMYGMGGQVVYLMPKRDLVVVRFGENAQLLHSTLYAAWRGIEE